MFDTARRVLHYSFMLFSCSAGFFVLGVFGIVTTERNYTGICMFAATASFYAGMIGLCVRKLQSSQDARFARFERIIEELEKQNIPT